MGPPLVCHLPGRRRTSAPAGRRTSRRWSVRTQRGRRLPRPGAGHQELAERYSRSPVEGSSHTSMSSPLVGSVNRSPVGFNAAGFAARGRYALRSNTSAAATIAASIRSDHAGSTPALTSIRPTTSTTAVTSSSPWRRFRLTPAPAPRRSHTRRSQTWSDRSQSCRSAS
jgi:hypothetical protein